MEWWVSQDGKGGSLLDVLLCYFSCFSLGVFAECRALRVPWVPFQGRILVLKDPLCLSECGFEAVSRVLAIQGWVQGWLPARLGAGATLFPNQEAPRSALFFCESFKRFPYIYCEV